MSQSSRKTRLILRLGALERPKQRLFSASEAEAANRIFSQKLAAMAKNRRAKPSKDGDAAKSPESLPENKDPSDYQTARQTMPKRSLRFYDSSKFRRSTPIAHHSRYLFPERPSSPKFLSLEQDPNEKVNEWLKKNSQFNGPSTSNENWYPNDNIEGENSKGFEGQQESPSTRDGSEKDLVFYDDMSLLDRLNLDEKEHKF